MYFVNFEAVKEVFFQSTERIWNIWNVQKMFPLDFMHKPCSFKRFLFDEELLKDVELEFFYWKAKLYNFWKFQCTTISVFVSLEHSVFKIYFISDKFRDSFLYAIKHKRIFLLWSSLKILTPFSSEMKLFIFQKRMTALYTLFSAIIKSSKVRKRH